MSARIYQQPKNAMQSGRANSNKWVLEYMPSDRKVADPLTGWAGSSDTDQQVKLQFDSLEAAQSYCKDKNIEHDVIATPNKTLKIQAYSDNFG